MVGLAEWYEEKATISISDCSKNGDLSLINSEKKVVDFDTIKQKFCSKHDMVDCNSNDAILKVNDTFCFIEFKDSALCSLNKKKISSKILDSLIVLMGELELSPGDVTKLSYALVYNENKGSPKAKLREVTEQQILKNSINDYFGKWFQNIEIISSEDFCKNVS